MSFIAKLRVWMVIGCLFAPLPLMAQSTGVPEWLRAHVGLNDGQIAPVVLDRARAHYLKKRRSGKVKNPCYMAMDATRPSATADGAPSRRFFTICEGQKIFRATSSGYGNGRKIPGANFSNGRQCARHFSNAQGSNLTSGGEYITAEARTSFKGFISQSGKTVPFYRSFLVFDGEGPNKNARDRFIGGHHAAFVRKQCRLKLPQSRHADKDGFVPFGRLVDYTAGRSNGCTTWTADASQDIIGLVNDNPTTLFIYPEAADITKINRALSKGQSLREKGLYWNASCLKAIGAPQFWPKRKLEPKIKAWRKSLPKSVWKPLPVCN